MEYQINRIDPLQAGKIVAALYFVVGLAVTPISLIGMFGNSPNESGPGVAVIMLIILLPFIYALLGFIFIPIICWVYNQISSRIGGLKITLTDMPATKHDQQL